MKKHIVVEIAIIAMMIFCMTFNVNAASQNVTLKQNKTEVEPGDTFTVTITGSCEEGINGLEALVTYESNQLELIESKVADDKWINIGQTTEDGIQLSIMCNSVNTIKDADIFKLTFKVKNDAERGSNAKVTVSQIALYSDTSQKYDIGTKNVSVLVKAATPTLSSIAVTKAPTKTTYTVGEKFNSAGMEITASYSDGSSKKIKNYTYAPTEQLKTADTKITITYVENGVTKTAEQKITVVNSTKEDNNNNTNQSTGNNNYGNNTNQGTGNTNNTTNNQNTGNSADNTTAKDNKLPQTGVENYLPIVIIIMAAISVLLYMQLRKYKNI